jgi:signal transduction histidine kinase
MNRPVQPPQNPPATQHKMESFLRGNLPEFTSILERITDGFFVVDREWRLIYLNQSAQMVAQRPREELLGTHLWDAYPHLVGTRVYDKYNEAMSSGKTIVFEESVPWIDSYFETSLYPSETGLSIFFRDITEQVRVRNQLVEARRKAEEGERAKARFLAHMSHEIRTPMNGVLGMANLLLNTRLNDEQARYVQSIRASAESLVTIIQDILDFSRMDFEHFHLKEEDIEVGSVFEETLTLLRSLAGEKKIHLTLKSDIKSPLWVHGDPRRIKQILWNIVGNGIKFTQKGGVTVTVAIVEKTKENIRLNVEIRDTGMGISPENLDKIFDPFSQFAEEVSSQKGGAGLGLTIARNLIELMQGKVSVTSILGQGSTFTFSLNLKTAAAKMFDFRAVPPREDSLKGKLILVAEDNDVSREIVSKVIERAGGRCILTTNGAQAVDTLIASPESIDVILMDCQMPVTDGFTATQMIRKISNPKLSSTPIIAVTAGVMPNEVEKAFEAGMDSFVSKPYNFKDLIATIHRNLRDSQPSSST